MPSKANPEVETDLNPELALSDLERMNAAPNPGDDIEDMPGPEVEPEDEAEPTAEEEPEPTSRRSKSKAGPKPVNLDEIPQFREWKSKTDRTQEELRRKLEEAQGQARQLAQMQANLQMQELQARISQAGDMNEQRALVDQMAALRENQYHQQRLEWEAWTKERAEKEGIDLSDARFQRQYTSADQFEADLLAAKADKLARENAELKRAVSPETVSALVKQQLAEMLQSQGFDQIDTGEGTPSNTSMRARDNQLLNMGKMSREQYLRKYGGR